MLCTKRRAVRPSSVLCEGSTFVVPPIKRNIAGRESHATKTEDHFFFSALYGTTQAVACQEALPGQSFPRSLRCRRQSEDNANKGGGGGINFLVNSPRDRKELEVASLQVSRDAME